MTLRQIISAYLLACGISINLILAVALGYGIYHVLDLGIPLPRLADKALSKPEQLSAKTSALVSEAFGVDPANQMAAA